MSIRPWGKLSEYDPAPAMVDGPDILIADDGRVFVGDLADLHLACRGQMFIGGATVLYAVPSEPMIVDQGAALIKGIPLSLRENESLISIQKECSVNLKILMPDGRVATYNSIPYRKKPKSGLWQFDLSVIKTDWSETLFLHHVDSPKAPIKKALDWLREPLELRGDHVTIIQEKMQRLCRRFDMYLISRITKAAKRNGHVFFEGYEHYLA